MRTPDRADLVPSNWAKNTLPNQPLYTQLLRLAYDAPQRVIICDVNRGEEKSRIQLLTDVIELRETLRLSLSESARRDLERGETVFIAVLAPGGYEYVVALLGALALGASAVPISECFPKYLYSTCMAETIYSVKRYPGPCGRGVVCYREVALRGRPHCHGCRRAGNVTRTLRSDEEAATRLPEDCNYAVLEKLVLPAPGHSSVSEISG